MKISERTRKHIPSALAWCLLIGIGLWFIYFATYHSDNVARTAIANNDKISKILDNQSIIIKGEEDGKKLLEKQQMEIDEIKRHIKLKTK